MEQQFVRFTVSCYGADFWLLNVFRVSEIDSGKVKMCRALGWILEFGCAVLFRFETAVDFEL